MKKGIIFIAFISMPVFSFCQEQFPVFSEDNTWEILEEGFDWSEYYHVMITGDTVINDKSYKIIESPYWWGSGILGFGYDEGGKTFFRPAEDWDYSYDMVLYDFNLVVGDTFRIPPFYSIEDFPNHIAIVLAIDSIELFDGSLRKRYNFGNSNNLPNTVFFNCLIGQEWTWIDGIGNPIHAVYPIMDCFESVVNLDCYSFQGQEMFGDCQYSPVQEPQTNNVEIFPNPTDNKLIVKAPGNEILSLLLLDINGHQVLLEKNCDHMNLSALSGGVYFLKIQMKSGSVFTERIVKY